MSTKWLQLYHKLVSQVDNSYNGTFQNWQQMELAVVMSFDIVNKFMIMQQIMLKDRSCQDLQNTPSPNQNKKTISHNIMRLTNQKQAGESIFRKPKKIIKTLKIETQPKFEDKVLIQQEIRNWLNKLHTSKDIKISKQKTHSEKKLSERNKQAITTIYDLMRKDEKLAQYLPMTSKHNINVRRDTLRLNLQEVSHLRCKSQKKKVAIQQIYFQSQIESKQSRIIGFRSIASRCPQRLIWNKKDPATSTPKVNNVSLFNKTITRTYSLQNPSSRNNTIQILNSQKSSKNIFESPLRIGNYINRSRLKKCWQSMGLKEWINKPTQRNLYQSKS